MKLSLPKLKLPSFRPGSLRLPFSRGQELAVGLDIGSHAVKACELAPTGDGYRLISLGSAMLPPDSLEDGALLDPDAVGSVIAALADNLKLKSKKVAISVSGYSVIVKKINLEVMSEKDLATHIQEEAEQYIPFDIDDVYLDFQDLKTNQVGDDRTDVMLVAAKKEVVDGYLGMLDDIGLKPVVVDVDAFALENAFEATAGASENVALVDIGASKMNINMLKGGISTLARDVVLGSRQLTERIAEELNIDFDEAEAIKVGSVPPAKDAHPRLRRIYQNACEQWVSEITRALDHYATNNPDSPINRIVLSGGGAKVAGLAGFVARETGVATELLNPFARCQIDTGAIDSGYLEQVSPEMALAAGLATRPVEF